MRRVIVNSKPLIALCNAGLLEILKKLYGKITISRAVFDEVTAKPDSACCQVKENLSWIVVEDVIDIADRKMYKAKLHAGEVDVMILAQTKPGADLVIIDDNAAKKTAKYLGLTVTGTFYCDPDKCSMPEFRLQYSWFIEQMCSKIGNPSAGIKFPVSAWDM